MLDSFSLGVVTRVMDSWIFALFYTDLVPRNHRPTEFIRENVNFRFIHDETIEKCLLRLDAINLADLRRSVKVPLKFMILLLYCLCFLSFIYFVSFLDFCIVLSARVWVKNPHIKKDYLSGFPKSLSRYV